MRVCSVSTHEYDTDITRLMKRRLDQVNFVPVLSGSDGKTAQAELCTDTDMDKWCSAISRLLLYDLAHFELARIVDDMPLSIDEKQLVLPEAVRNSRAVMGYNVTKRMLLDHFSEHESLNLEGFMRFRMRDIQKSWELCALRAVEELALKTEYLELMSVLSAFVQIQPSRVREVRVVLNPDGSCTLTDDMDSRIDCEHCTGDGVVSVLVGLAPERIIVYDLSGGQNWTLAEVLLRVFEDRIRFYR